MFDYIVIGAGSAGCVLANRLSEDPDTTVLLLEAGPPDERGSIRTPSRFRETWYQDVAWQYLTQPEPYLLSGRVSPSPGRRVFWPRGRTLGGSSSIGNMVYMRGNRRDFDHWSYLGNEGWGFADILPYFKKSEDQERGADDYHGAGGPMAVRDLSAPNPSTLAFVEASAELGHPPRDDFNKREQDGVGLVQVHVENGQRVSTATAFLHPVRERPNLVVQTHAQAGRILFEGVRAVGAEYVVHQGPAPLTFQARAHREVLVSCGTVDSPKLLMLSGIGPADTLRSLGLPVVADLPGVGENLQDHLVVAVGYRYAPGTQSAPAAAGIAEASLFTHTRPGLQTAPPDLMVHFTHWALLHPEYLLSPLPPPEGFSFVPMVVRPQSRGRITLRSAAAEDPPVIHANYLESESDLEILRAGLELCREIVQGKAFRKLRGEEVAPGPQTRTKDELQRYIRLVCHGLFHPVGTCKMGRDRMAVVDPQLRVYGVEGLRVIDAAVMPTITTGNTNAPTMMIGEKGADLVRGTIPVERREAAS